MRFSVLWLVRASTRARSDSLMRLVQFLCPVSTNESPVESVMRSALVMMLVVSEPAAGSVMEKACRRSSPLAIG